MTSGKTTQIQKDRPARWKPGGARGYDPQCHALAQVFLADVMPLSDHAAKLADELAQDIQDMIEGFIAQEVPHQISRACWCEPTVEKP